MKRSVSVMVKVLEQAENHRVSECAAVNQQAAEPTQVPFAGYPNAGEVCAPAPSERASTESDSTGADTSRSGFTPPGFEPVEVMTENGLTRSVAVQQHLATTDNPGRLVARCAARCAIIEALSCSGVGEIPNRRLESANRTPAL